MSRSAAVCCLAAVLVLSSSAWRVGLFASAQGMTEDGVSVDRASISLTLRAGETKTETLRLSALQRTRILFRSEPDIDEVVLPDSRRLQQAETNDPPLSGSTLASDAIHTRERMHSARVTREEHGEELIPAPVRPAEEARRRLDDTDVGSERLRMVVDVRELQDNRDADGQELFPTDRVIVGWRCDDDSADTDEGGGRRRLTMKRRLLSDHIATPRYLAGRDEGESTEPLIRAKATAPPAGGGTAVNHLRLEGVCEIDLVQLRDKTLHGMQEFFKAFADGDPDNKIAMLSPDLTLRLQQGGDSSREWVLPDDPYFPLQWSLEACPPVASGLRGGSRCERDPTVDMDLPQAWAVDRGDNDITVAVLDTGVNYRHPDLFGTMWTNQKELDGVQGVDDDNNGYVDDFVGYNFFDKNNNPMDDNGHGSHVSGVIAARTNNRRGIAGISKTAKIMALKVLGGEGAGNLSGHLRAVEYAVDNGARVINNSLGSHPGLSPTDRQRLRDLMKPAMIYALDTVFITAAGNSGLNISVYPEYPASLIGDWTLTIASYGLDGKLSPFSNYGATNVHVAAPGGNITSSYTGENYVSASGTSMACPMASGVAALVLAQNPSLQPQQVVDILVQSARPDPTLQDRTISGGRLNAYRAMLIEPHFFFAPSDQDLVITPVAPQTLDIKLDARRLKAGVHKGRLEGKWYREIFGQLREFKLDIPIEMTVEGDGNAPEILQDATPPSGPGSPSYVPPPPPPELPGEAGFTQPDARGGTPSTSASGSGTGGGTPEVVFEESAGSIFWVSNECPADVRIAVRYYDTRPGESSGEWKSLCWGTARAGGEGTAPKYLLRDARGEIRSTREDWYFYAETPGGDIKWQGAGDSRTVCTGELLNLRKGRVDPDGVHYAVLSCPDSTLGGRAVGTDTGTTAPLGPSPSVEYPSPASVSGSTTSTSGRDGDDLNLNAAATILPPVEGKEDGSPLILGGDGPFSSVNWLDQQLVAEFAHIDGQPTRRRRLVADTQLSLQQLTASVSSLFEQIAHDHDDADADSADVPHVDMSDAPRNASPVRSGGVAGLRPYFDLEWLSSAAAATEPIGKEEILQYVMA
ncbi:unnamed protein product [Vitrella brassicaformis CCMP3155]|uniref:subtilisin n=2 Tax=Vitrella brassicaformis TaxID=1169539 RepID=A0A0G4H895_VITBC|nr:unnamed protein product [Vitrella brassicaformis CCMP3155]|eukprot:CEM40075.1 unnamed protein product [Vitrella brassicaformis CCMP3155]